MAVMCVTLNMLVWLHFVALSSFYVVQGKDANTFPLLMPHVVPRHKDSYLCTAVRLDPTQEYYITAFQPNASVDVAHHMLIFGCDEPASNEEVWTCGGNSPQALGECANSQEIMYAWSKDAPKFTLPPQVGFKVGGASDVQYLVLQVHYASVQSFRGGHVDDSGVVLHYTEKPVPKLAGVLLLGTEGRILPHSIEYMETACAIDENIVIHPFAFRTHTHSLGRVVSGYKIELKDRETIWTLIGKKDPQLPQMFYPIPHDMTLSKGDMIASRCTMESSRDYETQIGTSVDDEMCNFYAMYWTYRRATLKMKNCFSPGPPNYYWDMEFLAVPRDASILPVEPEP